MDAIQSLGLALHELATNAVKYGALSVSAGEVHIDWRLESGSAGLVLRLDWTEQGGPRVNQPKRKGFGQVVLKQMIEQALAAEAKIDYPATGVRWSMRASASKLMVVT
jgi:two-component system CheB/CheR fusion protein